MTQGSFATFSSDGESFPEYDLPKIPFPSVDYL